MTLTIWPSIVERTWRTSPVPWHWGQVTGAGAGSAPLPAHVSQRVSAVNVDLLLGAVDRLVERQLEVVAQVGAGRATRAPPAARRGATEERVEDVAEALEAAERPVRRRGSPAAVPTPAWPNMS